MDFGVYCNEGCRWMLGVTSNQLFLAFGSLHCSAFSEQLPGIPCLVELYPLSQIAISLILIQFIDTCNFSFDWLGLDWVFFLSDLKMSRDVSLLLYGRKVLPFKNDFLLLEQFNLPIWFWSHWALFLEMHDIGVCRDL